MALVDLEKTKFKFNDVKWLISIGIAIGVGAWRFESQMADVRLQMLQLALNQESLRKDIVNNYTIELLKISNRIDLIEAKKPVQRYNFKRSSSNNDVNVVINGRNANRDNHKKEKYPQFCMIPPRGIEYETRPKLPNIKKLMS